MTVAPRVTIEQWRTLIAVVEAGGYAAAAEALHKSQSAVTYAVQKLEDSLGVPVFQIQGRKAVLTGVGSLLYRRARELTREAAELEGAARHLAAGWEAEIRLAVDAIYPVWLTLEAVDEFAGACPFTRIQLFELVMSGVEEALVDGTADLAIGPVVPPGFHGESLMRVRFVAVAHPDHPLHRLDRPLDYRDLRAHRQLVVRNSGTRTDREDGWLGADQRWTVTTFETSVEAAVRGLGFAWYPELRIRDALRTGRLKPLPLRDGAARFIELYLMLPDRELAGPATRRLAELIREHTVRHCREADTGGTSESAASITDSETLPQATAGTTT